MPKSDYFNDCLREEQPAVALLFQSSWKSARNALRPLVVGERGHRGRRGVFLMGMLLVSAVTVEGLVVGVAPFARTSLVWMMGASAFGWMGAVLPRRRWQVIAAMGLSSCVVLSLAPHVGHSASTSVLAAVSLISFWCSLFVPVYCNLALWSLATIVIFSAGGALSVNTLNVQDPYSYPVLALLSYMLAPLFIGTLLRRDETARHEILESNIDDIRVEREELRRAYAKRTQEIELSRHAIVEAERTQTTSRIASGLAHELNNILTPIHGLAELLVQNPHSAQTERYARSILHSAQSASMMTQALLTYTHQGQFDPVILESSQVFSHLILPEIKTMIPSDVQLHTNVEPEILLHLDRRLMLQAVWHLLRNSIEAMPKGGVLLLSLTRLSPQKNASVKLRKSEGDWARLSVIDNGCGISQENLASVFDPFFTTKTFGVGAGLGLALVHGAVTKHGGKISMESTVDKGTQFHIDLPIVTGKAVELDEDPTSLYLPVKARVRIASPNPDFRDEVEEDLAEKGWPVDRHESLRGLLQACAQSGGENAGPQDWILDAQLCPTGPSSQLCEILRAADGPRVLVVLAPNQVAQWTAVRVPGRVELVSKPLARSTLDLFLETAKQPPA